MFTKAPVCAWDIIATLLLLNLTYIPLREAPSVVDAIKSKIIQSKNWTLLISYAFILGMHVAYLNNTSSTGKFNDKNVDVMSLGG